MFGAQVRDNLRNILVSERVGERRHLLSAVENLILQLFRRPGLVLSYSDQGRSLLRADSARAMTVGAPFIAKQNCAGHFVGFSV